MIRTVQQGRHRFSPAPVGLTCTDIISRMVQFDYDCRYDLKSLDQLDINKLFGVGFFPNHHRNSARVGWRYNRETERIDLFTYVYHNGRRLYEYLCDVKLGETFRATITLEGKGYGFIIQRENKTAVHRFVRGNPSFIGYKLGAWFGGNRPAPHKMHIWISPLSKSTKG